MARNVIVTADKVRNRKRTWRIVRISLLLLLLFMIVTFFILRIIYYEGRFTIVLDRGLLEEGLVIFEDERVPRREIFAEPMADMDNISWKWLPDDIGTESSGGAHNRAYNYIAHTFYLENRGTRNLTYWLEVNIDAVTREVDEGIRIKIIHNHEQTIYAKKSRITGLPETVPPITVPFLEDKGDTIILESRPNFGPGDRDRFTIVIWIEGDDPDTLDPMIGGILRMHMRIIGELVN